MDLISRQAAIDACIRVREHRAYDEIEEIEKLPSAQPERKKGKWIKHPKFGVWECDQCGTRFKFNFKYHSFCPNCGADMRGEQDG